MLDIATIVDPVHNCEDGVRGPTRTRLVASLQWRSTAKGVIRITMTCLMKFAAEMHKTRLTTGTKTESVRSRSDVMRGIMIIMVLTMTNLLVVLKPNRIICKRTDTNCSSFHLRVFLELLNP
jgi:hypothetical protein